MPLYLHAAIAICDQHLSPDAHAALCALSVFASKPDSFSKEAALKVSQRSVEALGELLDAGLLESWGPERYTLHQTVADYACAQNEVLVVHQQIEDIQIRQQESYSSGEPLSLQGVGISRMRSRSRLPFRMNSSWLPLITLSTTLLATLAMIVLLLAFTRLPSSSSLKQATSSPVAQSPLGTSYEAEAPENILTGDANVLKCSSCSEGRRIGNIGFGKKSGESGTLQFNRISEKRTGNYMLNLYYISGSGGRVIDVSVNGGPTIAVYAPSTNKWSVVRTLSIPVHLKAGYNTIKFFNPLARGPDIDCIIV